jgi:hypothetical protein
MRIISFIEEPKAIDRIIAHLKLTFEAERPPPPQIVQQELLMAAEERGDYLRKIVDVTYPPCMLRSELAGGINMETSWKEELNELIEVLGLEHKPVAVTFTNDLVELGERKPVWICRALKLAAQGESLVIEKENCTCPGGSWHSGLGERPPRERWRGVQRFLTHLLSY